jgi:hypothetical protein
MALSSPPCHGFCKGITPAPRIKVKQAPAANPSKLKALVLDSLRSGVEDPTIAAALDSLSEKTREDVLSWALAALVKENLPKHPRRDRNRPPPKPVAEKVPAWSTYLPYQVEVKTKLELTFAALRKEKYGDFVLPYCNDEYIIDAVKTKGATKWSIDRFMSVPSDDKRKKVCYTTAQPHHSYYVRLVELGVQVLPASEIWDNIPVAVVDKRRVYRPTKPRAPKRGSGQGYQARSAPAHPNRDMDSWIFTTEQRDFLIRAAEKASKEALSYQEQQTQKRKQEYTESVFPTVYVNDSYVF